VKEDRCGEDHRIEPVEHAAMSLDHPAPVIDAAIALDGRHHQAAAKSHQVYEQRHQARPPRRKRGDLAAEQLAPDILQNVARPCHEYQERDQKEIAPFETGGLPREQRRHVGEAEHGNHQPPLHLGGTAHEVYGVHAQRGNRPAIEPRKFFSPRGSPR
jgi:hypothetical protein